MGTSVTLSVQHSNSKLETFTIQREVIHVGTVLGNSRKPDGSWDFMLDPERRIGYIRVTSFSRETAADLRKALEDLKREKVRALVLDLRFNPGGLLSSAVEVSNLFISKGRIVSTKGRNTAERVWEATPGEVFEGFPMVVLVNHYSASASEVVAACLQDNGRAVVAGDRTWGKGSVQNVVELESGRSALKLTTSSYTRPNGHKIHRFPDDKDTDEWGVKPDNGLELKLSPIEIAELLASRRIRDVVEGDHREGKQHSSQTTPPVAKTNSNTEKSKPSDLKPAATRSDKSPTAGANGNNGREKKTAAGAAVPKFVDRQLQKAVEYLTTELVRAQ